MNSPDTDDLFYLLSPPGPDSGPPDALPRAARPATPDAPLVPLLMDFSEAEFATLIGLTPRQVRNYVRDGIIAKNAMKRFDAAEVAKYCAHVRSRLHKGVPRSEELTAERIRKERAAAEKIELQNAAARGELLPSAEVLATWSGILRDVRGGLLALPARFAAELPGLTKAEVAKIDRLIRDALEDLADDR